MTVRCVCACTREKRTHEGRSSAQEGAIDLHCEFASELMARNLLQRSFHALGAVGMDNALVHLHKHVAYNLSLANSPCLGVCLLVYLSSLLLFCPDTRHAVSGTLVKEKFATKNSAHDEQ